MASSSSPQFRGRSCLFDRLSYSLDSGSPHSLVSSSLSPTSVVRDNSSIREVWCASQNALLLTSEKDKDLVCLYSEPYAQECFETKKKIDNFFRTNFHRSPIPYEGRNVMKTLLNHPLTEDNASYWNEKDLVVEIGKWDEKYFNLDVVFADTDILTHEFGHAMTQSVAGLVYFGETGSLDESTSDIFSIMHKHQLAGIDANSPDASWEIAEGLIKNSDGTTSPLRSMKLPGTAYKDCIPFASFGRTDDVQVMDYRHRDFQKWSHKTSQSDRGVVYPHSGIPNRAFYLMAYNIGGKSWETAGDIWFQALLKASPEDDFALFAGRTIKEAKQRYGTEIENIVRRAWDEVGVIPRTIR